MISKLDIQMITKKLRQFEKIDKVDVYDFQVNELMKNADELLGNDYDTQDCIVYIAKYNGSTFFKLRIIGEKTTYEVTTKKCFIIIHGKYTEYNGKHKHALRKMYDDVANELNPLIKPISIGYGKCLFNFK